MALLFLIFNIMKMCMWSFDEEEINSDELMFFWSLVIMRSFLLLKVADLNFGCATFCALPSFGAVTTFSSHTTVSSHKVSVKGSDTDMCSAIYFLFDHNTKYCTNYLCPHTVVATV